MQLGVEPASVSEELLGYKAASLTNEYSGKSFQL